MISLELLTPIIWVGIALALVFDFVNGMNDAANAIATVVSTRVVPPRLALIWAAGFNVIGAFAFGVSVATTIGKGIVEPSVITPTVIVAALIGAIVWVYTCVRFGLPISVSHSLIGGLCGAALLKTHTLSALVGSGLIKVGAFIVLAPILGLLISGSLMVMLNLLVASWYKRTVELVFSKMQLFSAATFSLAHGTNDAQKTMGIISILLFSGGALGKEFFVPWEVIIACTAAMGLGTLAGGWKTIETMGTKLTNLKPLGGCAAETGASISVIGCSLLGIPVSTTHTIAGSIVGVGLVRNVGAVRWGKAKHILWAWILTIPITAVIGALCYAVMARLGL